MRKFLSSSLIILALVVGAAGAAPAAHAQTLTQDQVNAANELGTPAQQAAQAVNPINAANELTPAQQAAQPTALTSEQSQAVAQQAAAGTPADANSPTPANPGGDTSAQFGTIMTWIMKLFAWLVGVAALELDYAVYYTVVTMGSYVHNLAAVGVAWRILRDIGNIMLIFGFLAVGITTILNVDWYGKGTKMLPMMLVAAVFLNFSLFITEAIIDTGNLFATQFFTQINGGSLPTVGPSGLTAGGVAIGTANEGISTRIMGQLGLQTIYGDAITNTTILKGQNSWLIGFMGIILFLVTAFVMFSLAFVLVARFIILIFLILLAPVGFAGLAIPMLAKRANQWWDKLFEQTVTAPILLLMLYIALAIITDVHFMTGFGSSSNPDGWTGFVRNAAGFSNLPGLASLVLSFLVAMGLLIAVVIQSKNLSAFGAGWASKTAGKLTFGATAFGLRSTVGWGSQSASQRLRRTSFGQTKYGRAAVAALDKGATASFDVRAAAIGGGLKGIGVEAGDAQKGGYRARQEASIKGHEEYVKSVGKAFDEHGAGGIAEAQRSKFIAENEQREANEEVKNATEAMEEQEKEITRLQKLEADNRNSGNIAASLEAKKLLDTATAAAAPGRKRVADANRRLKDASDRFKETDEAEKEVSGNVTREKRKAQVAYADDIKGSLAGWAMFGPGGSAAANSIVKDALKSADKKLLEDIRKAIAVGESKGGESAPAAKPAEETH